MENEELMDAASVSRYLSVSYTTVYQYQKRGLLVPAEIRWEGLRRKPMFRRSDVEKLRRPLPPEETSGE